MYLKTPIIWRSLNTIQLHVEVGINLLQVRLHTTLMIIQMQHITLMAMKILDLRPPPLQDFAARALFQVVMACQCLIVLLLLNSFSLQFPFCFIFKPKYPLHLDTHMHRTIREGIWECNM